MLDGKKEASTLMFSLMGGGEECRKEETTH